MHSRCTQLLFSAVVCLLSVTAFTVTVARGAAVQITAPNDGAAWAAGSRHFVMWKSEGLPASAHIKLEFTHDDGKQWTPLVAKVPNTGRFLWTVPNHVSKECRVRIVADLTGRRIQNRTLFSIIPTQKVSNYRWRKITLEAAFAPRDGAGALVFKNKLWLLGGWNPGDKTYFPRICNNEVWNSTDGETWTLVKQNTFLDKHFDTTRDWEGRHTAGYVVYRGKMWIVGGDANQLHYQSDVWNSADGKTWNNVNKNVPWAPRVLHYTLVFKDRIWVIGGQTMPGFAKASEVFYRDIWNTTDGIHWKQVAPVEPYWSPRGMIGGNVVFKDRIWILGGGTYDTPQTRMRNFYNDVWSSPDGVNWKRHVAGAPWNPRQYHDVAVFDKRMWILEGYHEKGGNKKDVWYSADGINWYELPETPWKPRHAASVFVHNNALWMVAGNNMQPDVWKLERAGKRTQR